MRRRKRGSKLPLRALFAFATAIALSGALVVHADEVENKGKDKETERFQVDAWVGEVINKFAAADRNNTLEPDGDVDNGDIDRFAGLRADFRFWNNASFGAHAFVEAMHTARVVEAPCTAGDPDCATDDSGNPIGNPEDFVKIIKDSSILEWHAGFHFDWTVRADTIVYVKARLGLIRSVDSGDDVIDDHFLGGGLKYADASSWFRDSFLEAGWGQTDFFATHNKNRTKVVARLVIGRPPDPEVSRDAIVNFFLEGYLDSDFGSGSDDIRIFLGVGFDIRELFSNLGGSGKKKGEGDGQ
jgi:hypothetical protein